MVRPSGKDMYSAPTEIKGLRPFFILYLDSRKHIGDLYDLNIHQYVNKLSALFVRVY